MKTLRTGVIGLGVGEQHVRSYQSIDGVEVVGICDVKAEHLTEVADRWDVAGRHTDWRKITEDPDIDIVSICSYDNFHAEQALSALRHGKHIFVEKPVCLFREDAETLARELSDSGLLLSSNLILRESPRFIELRQQIQAGLYGDIFHIEGDYLHQILWKITEGWRGAMDFYCVAYGGGIHLIDLMRWLTGFEATEVAAMGNNLRSNGSQFQFDDCVTALLRYDSGATGKCLTTLGAERTQLHALNIFGTAGSFVNDLPHAKRFAGEEAENEVAVKTPYPAMQKGDLLPDFIEAIRAGRQPNVGARDVFRVMDICFAIREALEQGRTVPVSYLM